MSIKYYVLRQSILEARIISQLHRSALFTIPLNYSILLYLEKLMEWKVDVK